MDADKTQYRQVFITGALGFVGQALARRYRELGAQVRGLDVRADAAQGVVAGSVAEPAAWQAQLDGSDLVIHTAAIVTNNTPRPAAWHVNVVGTQRVLEAAAAGGARRFVHFSTMGVVRFVNTNPADCARLNPARPVDERWPLMPTGNPYSDTKIAAEHLVLAAHAAGELDCTIIRPSDIYGPGCRPWVLQPLTMIRKGLFLLPERGQGLFCPIYVDDVVEAVVLAAETEEARGQIFQVGGEACVTAETYFGHFYRMLGKPGPPRSFSTPVAVAIAETARVGFTLARKPTELGRGVMVMLAKKRTFSNEKARRVLGWEPRVSLDEGMARTEAWLRAAGLL